MFCRTPANTAGLQAGDVIVAVNGHPVTSATTLHAVISNYHPGNTVSLTWVEAGGQKHTGSLTLAAGPVKYGQGAQCGARRPSWLRSRAIWVTSTCSSGEWASSGSPGP